MDLQDPNRGFGCKQPAQRLQPNLGSRPDGLLLFHQSCGVDALGVGYLDYFPTKLLHDSKDLITNLAQRPTLPIVAVDDVIGLVFEEVWDIAPLLLGNHGSHTFDVLNHHFPLFIGEIGKPLMWRNSRVSQQAHDKLSMLGPFVDDVDDSRMDDITGHT